MTELKGHTWKEFCDICEEENIDPEKKLRSILQKWNMANETYEGKYRNFRMFIQYMRNFQLKDFDVVVPISSMKGMGKSTTAIQLSKHYLKKFYPDKKFSFKKNVAFGNRDVMKKLDEIDEYQPLVADEAVDFGMGEDWNKRESKELKKVISKIRTKHLILFLCIPNFFWLDSKYRQTLATMWVHLIGRGFAATFLPDMSPGAKDRWHRKQFDKKIGYFSHKAKKTNILSLVKKHPCYEDYFSVPKLPDRLYERYQKVRDKHIFTTGISEKKDLLKVVFYNLYTMPKEKWPDKWTTRKIEELLCKSPFSDETQLSYSTVSRHINEIKKAVKEYNKN